MEKKAIATTDLSEMSSQSPSALLRSLLATQMEKKARGQYKIPGKEKAKKKKRVWGKS